MTLKEAKIFLSSQKYLKLVDGKETYLKYVSKAKERNKKLQTLKVFIHSVIVKGNQ